MSESNLFKDIASLLWSSVNAFSKPYRQSKAVQAPGDMKVISVGNILAGGVGKTEVVAEIGRELSIRTGRPILICLRGYGAPQALPESGVLMKPGEFFTAEQVGDEALVHREKNPSAYILVGASRAKVLAHHWSDGKEASLEVRFKHLPPPIVILDDGMQHETLHKDVEVVVHDFRLKNSYFREFRNSLLRPELLRLSFSGVPKPYSDQEWFKVHYVLDENIKKSLVAKAPMLFCALGNPNRLRSFLHFNDLDLAGERFFPDHHFYSGADLHELEQWFLAKQSSDSKVSLVTTLKDFVKIPAQWRMKMQPYLHVLQIKLEFLDPNAREKFYANLIQRISE